MSLTNPNKVVTEQRLAEFYAAILPYLGGMPEALANKFAKGDLYSTTEKIVGCWTDGRPVYQKTISTTGLSSSTNPKEVSHGISNIGTVVNIFGVANAPSWSNKYIPITSAAGVVRGNVGTDGSIDPNASYIQVVATGTAIKIFHKPYTSNDITIYVTIQYTKTTDAANSFNYSSETDYSTTEHIIGTWIDGKPLYQKTVNFGALPNNSTKTVSSGLTGIKVIDIKGYMYRPSTPVMNPLPFSTTTAADCVQLSYQNSTNSIYVKTGKDYSAYTECYVTIQYTKS